MKNKDFEFIANIIADKIGVSLIRGKEWSADLDNRTIKYPDVKLNDSDVGFLIHEASHLRFTKFDLGYNNKVDQISKEHGKRSDQIFDLFNSLEDIRVDRKIVDVFPGAKKYLDYNNYSNYNRICDIAWNEMYKPDAEKKFPDNIKFCLGATFDYATDYDSADSFRFNFCSDEMYEVLKECRPDLDKIVNCDSALDLFDLMVEKILPYYLPFCDDYTEEERKKDDKKEKEDKEKEKEELEKKLKELLDKIKKALKGAIEREKERQEKSKGEGEGKDGEKDEEDKDEEGEGKGKGKGEDYQKDDKDTKKGKGTGDSSDGKDNKDDDKKGEDDKDKKDDKKGDDDQDGGVKLERHGGIHSKISDKDSGDKAKIVEDKEYSHSDISKIFDVDYGSPKELTKDDLTNARKNISRFTCFS